MNWIYSLFWDTGYLTEEAMYGEEEDDEEFFDGDDQHTIERRQRDFMKSIIKNSYSLIRKDHANSRGNTLLVLFQFDR